MGIYIINGGLHLAIVSILDDFVAHCHDKNLLSEWLHDIVDMMRRPKDRKLLEKLIQKTQELIPLCDNEACTNILSTVYNAKENVYQHIQDYDKFALDYSSTTFFALIQEWHKRLDSRIDAIVDESKFFEAASDILQRWSKMRNDVTIDLGFKIWHSGFPMGNFSICNTKDYRELQIAGIIASSVCLAKREQTNANELQNKILQSRLALVQGLYM